MSDREDAILERVLRQVENGGLEDPTLDLEVEDRATWRELSELVTLLPYALDPIEPDPAVKASLMSRLDENRVSVDESSATLPFPAPAPSSMRSLQLLAAALGVLALGLALLSGWMFRGSQLREDTISRLNAALIASSRQQMELGPTYEQLGAMRSVVTSSGMSICPLRPWGDSPAQPIARGVMYFDGAKQRWLLTARGLEPCDKGSKYALWFMVGDKAVRGGSFEVEPNLAVTLGADQMPEGTTAVLLTLEADADAPEPTGPRILFGDETEEML